MLKVIDCEQGSLEWFAAKCGVPSASNFDCIITSKGQTSKQRQKYLYQLAGEILSGQPEESYQNAAMLRGKELETEAREMYQLVTGQEVKQVGFCITNGYGASPDGLVGNDGLLEIKCPKMATHIGYLIDNVLPTDYFQQVQGQLLVTGRKWCDFVSYYPDIRPLIIRVERNKLLINSLRTELKMFVDELKELVKKIGG